MLNMNTKINQWKELHKCLLYRYLNEKDYDALRRYETKTTKLQNVISKMKGFDKYSKETITDLENYVASSRNWQYYYE